MEAIAAVSSNITAALTSNTKTRPLTHRMVLLLVLIMHQVQTKKVGLLMLMPMRQVKVSLGNNTEDNSYRAVDLRTNYFHDKSTNPLF